MLRFALGASNPDQVADVSAAGLEPAIVFAGRFDLALARAVLRALTLVAALALAGFRVFFVPTRNDSRFFPAFSAATSQSGGRPRPVSRHRTPSNNSFPRHHLRYPRPHPP